MHKVLYKSTASPNNFKKDPHIIKLHTDEGPKEGGSLCLWEIYDHREVFEGENQRVARGKSGNMCLVCVRAAEGSSRVGRGASLHVAWWAGITLWQGWVSGQHQCPCACGAGEPYRAVAWPRDF